LLIYTSFSESLGEKNLEKEFDRQLDGAKGIIYLMFLGREVNTFYVAQNVMATRIVQKLPTVYGYVNELQRKNLIRLVEVEKGKRGPSKLRTANAEPMLKTIKRRYALRDERWKRKFQTLFKNLRGILDHFPEYLSEKSNKKVENMLWDETLSIFLSFCKQVINECYWLKKDPYTNVSCGYSGLTKDYKEGKIDAELYRLLRKANVAMAPYDYIKKSLKHGTFIQKNLTSIAALSGEPQYDIYEESFSGELFYMSTALRDPYLAPTLKRYIKCAVEYGKQTGR